MSSGVIYYNRGISCVVRLIVSIKSLRQYYSGPITVFLEDADISNLQDFLDKYHVDIFHVDPEKLDNSYVRKIAISKLSPYDKTVFIDADTLVVGDVDELFNDIDTHDLCVTQFCNWVSNGRAISRRIKGFAKYLPQNTLEKALSYGPAVNTGIYSFPKNSVMFEEWLELAKLGQSGKLYIPDEIACQILLHKYNVKILESKFNVSVKFGINQSDKRIIHYHGRKHCRKFKLAEFWIKAFIELLKSNDAANIQEYINNDNNLRKFLQFKYGWNEYVNECSQLLGIKNEVDPTTNTYNNEAPNYKNTTVVTACDPKYVECLKLTYPTWIKYKNINQFPMIVYVNGFLDNDSRLNFLRQYKNVKIIHWDMHNVDNHREKMLSCFVFGPARDVTTKYWLKLDADAYATNTKPILQNDMSQYAICGHKWKYTKPYQWIGQLNEWSINKGLGFVHNIDENNIKHKRYYHNRTNSFVQLHSTEFIKEAAKLAGDRLPVPSQDTYLWYVAEGLGRPIKRYNFKKYTGIFNKKTPQQIKDVISKTLNNSGSQIKLHIGCGRKRYEGWINTDKNELDITNTDSWNKNNINIKSVDKILAEHVFEHLSDKDRHLAIANLKSFIKDDGSIRIAVPDGFHPNQTYIENVKVGGIGKSADDHKFLYDHISLTKLFEDYGFKCELLEYFDSNGQFHFKEWSAEDGYIKRSSRYDRRNKKEKLSYTSLIIDCKLQ